MRALVRRRRISTLLLGWIAIPAAILAGCGGDDDGGGDVDVGPAAAVPANAPIYVDATVKPSGSAESDAKAALGKVFDTNDPGGEVVSLIDQEGRQQAAKERFTYAADIEPWLGESVGFFFTNFAGEGTGASVVETTDPERALAFARKSESSATQTSEQSGTTVYTNPADGDSFAIVGDFLLFGDTEAVNAAIVADRGESLGDSSDFTDALGNLPDDRLGTIYTVPKNLLDAIPAEEIDPSSRSFFESAAGENLNDPVAGSLTATSDSFDLEFQSEGGGDVETPESSLMGDVPGDAWLALGLGDLGETVKQVIEQLKDSGIPGFERGLSQFEQISGTSVDELGDALGDAVVYVQGTTEQRLTGALIVKAQNVELASRLINQLQGFASLGGASKPLSLPGGGTGFQINDPTNFPRPVEIGLQNDRVVIAYGAGSAQDALDPSQQLADSTTFSDAQGKVSALGADLFLSFPQIFQLAEASGAKSDPDYVDAKPYIAALEYLVSGSGTDDGQAEVKAVLGLK
jgi:Protein of unknown function (DUF3352)